MTASCSAACLSCLTPHPLSQNHDMTHPARQMVGQSIEMLMPFRQH
jgi:hypothetical protein